MQRQFKTGDTFRVRHPLWTADLIVDDDRGRLRHGTHQSRASYDAAGDVLFVKWDQYEPEVFVRHGDEYRPADLAGEHRPDPRRSDAVDLFGRPQAAVGPSWAPVESVGLALPGGVGTVHVRPGTSDIPVLEAIFVAKEYDVPVLGADCDIVVDLGANTGLSAVYFSHRCPNARVIAVEPARGNMALLRANALHRPAIHPVEAAIWPEDCIIALQDAEASGAAMHAWAYRTVERASGLGSYAVEALSLPTLMQRYGIGTIDVLKIDIEGAEQPLFSRATEPWLPRVRAIIIETHERFCPGVDALVSRVLDPDFVELAPNGENRVFRRRS